MRKEFYWIVTMVAVATARPAAADTVSDWWEFGSRLSFSAQQLPGSGRSPEGERALSRVSLAMFEALNAIDRRYESYLGMARGDSSASQDAAAATAAFRVLLTNFPAQKTSLEENYAIAMAAVKDSKSREAGRLIGEQAATAAMTVGGIDPAVPQLPYRPRTAPGQWVPTMLPVLDPYWAAFRPWAIPSAEALRPPPPPSLTSAQWARDYEEVRRFGGKSSTERTPHQSLMARYRQMPDLAPSLRIIADGRGRRPVQNARMFTLFQMAADDAGLATAAAKTFYDFWRPITAIRNGSEDGNEGTKPDASWTPLLATPVFAEYPCGHCTFAGAIAEVMTAETGIRPAGGVRVSSLSVPNAVVQALPSWDEWASQVSDSRIYGGVHYRFANEAGELIGRRAARIVLERVMRPLAPMKKR